jgi:hypothetical protein
VQCRRIDHGARLSTCPRRRRAPAVGTRAIRAGRHRSGRDPGRGRPGRLHPTDVSAC